MEMEGFLQEIWNLKVFEALVLKVGGDEQKSFPGLKWFFDSKHISQQKK